MNRKRKLIGVFAGVLVTASVAMAAWLVLGLISGEGTSKTGKASTTAPVTATISFTPSEGLVPEDSAEGVKAEKVQAAIPAEPQAYEVKGWKVKLTDTNEAACPTSNFKLVSEKEKLGGGKAEGNGGSELSFEEQNPDKVKVSEAVSGIEVVQVKIATTAPSACESTSFSLKATAIHS
ncbi:MAG TPA: hypothetical protein VGH09_12455 [Solirubrobacteraceae bacterium]|jgi:hypothetical protein